MFNIGSKDSGATVLTVVVMFLVLIPAWVAFVAWVMQVAIGSCFGHDLTFWQSVLLVIAVRLATATTGGKSE